MPDIAAPWTKFWKGGKTRFSTSTDSISFDIAAGSFFKVCCSNYLPTVACQSYCMLTNLGKIDQILSQLQELLMQTYYREPVSREQNPNETAQPDGKSVSKGKSMSVRVGLGCR